MDPRSEVKLLPCPFCGGTAALADEGDRIPTYLVFCNSCGISTDTDTRQDRPVSDWNTRRATSPEVEAEIRAQVTEEIMHTISERWAAHGATVPAILVWLQRRVAALSAAGTKEKL